MIPLNGGTAGLIVPEGEDGVPSPDGTRIASTGADGTTIWVTGVNGGRPRQIHGGGMNSFSALINLVAGWQAYLVPAGVRTDA